MLDKRLCPGFRVLISFVTAVFVGADRVVANGDTANKVGTYQLAIAAKYHGIPFYVAAPSTSCDLSMEHGGQIVIEERPSQELTDVNGVRVAAPGTKLLNHGKHIYKKCRIQWDMDMRLAPEMQEVTWTIHLSKSRKNGFVASGISNSRVVGQRSRHLLLVMSFLFTPGKEFCCCFV